MNEEDLKRMIQESVRESLRELAPKPDSHTDDDLKRLMKESVREEVKESLRELSPAPRPESNSHSDGHEEGKPHYIGAWQQYCPTCGDKNPDFKDETVCEDCGTHLGAKEVAEKLKACPNCGGHKAKKL